MLEVISAKTKKEGKVAHDEGVLVVPEGKV